MSDGVTCLSASDILASLAFIASLLALWISWKTYDRDTHSIKVHKSIFGHPSTGWNVSISVANVGRRPISIVHKSYESPDGRHCSFSFLHPEAGSARIEEGDSVATEFKGENGQGFFRTTEEARATKFFITDSLGETYQVGFDSGKKSILQKLKIKLMSNKNQTL
ncbi:hypothetical protein ORI98_06030 [Shewanella sp. ULN5]|uniref:hypothetical protein n=1 Tax=Shewanella sp. ULN5 TaxID=2994678 RepID=UPI00273E6D48|nr:hypothetical protein [Shewanella sp. ULN5]MDP5145992.1 hypothetical protein [Shewanella sp. ULN5]